MVAHYLFSIDPSTASASVDLADLAVVGAAAGSVVAEHCHLAADSNSEHPETVCLAGYDLVEAVVGAFVDRFGHYMS